MKKDSGDKFFIKGEWLTAPQIGKRYKLSASVIRQRIKKGFRDDEIVKSAGPKQYTINGETMTVKEFSQKYNISYDTLNKRIKRNMPDELLLLPASEYTKRLKEYAKEKTVSEIAHAHCLTWTQSALECYELGGICKKCSMPLDIQKRCKMLETIKRIVKLYSKPYDRTEERNFLKER